MDFATAVKTRRLAARLTQEELAARAGVNVRSIRDIERGRVRHPRPATARLLGIAARAVRMHRLVGRRLGLAQAAAIRDKAAGLAG